MFAENWKKFHIFRAKMSREWLLFIADKKEKFNEESQMCVFMAKNVWQTGFLS